MPISHSGQKRPLTLGGFARTLLTKPKEENAESNGEYDLSPDSVRKLLLFPKRSLTNLRHYENHNGGSTSKENSPPTEDRTGESISTLTTVKIPNVGTGPVLGTYNSKTVSGTNHASVGGYEKERRGITSSAEDVSLLHSSSSVRNHGISSTPCSTVKGDINGIKSEVLISQKSIGGSDSGIASSMTALSLTEALDLSCGSISKHSHLHTIKEASESPSAVRKLHVPEPRSSPRKLGKSHITKSEGCIHIHPDPNKVTKPSPPLRGVDPVVAPPPAVIIKIPSNPTPSSIKRSSSITSTDAKRRVRKLDDKFSSLRGTPRGYNAAMQAELAKEEQVKRTKPSNSVTDWNFETEVVQAKKYLLIKQLGKGGSGEVSLVVEQESKSLFALKRVNLNGINDAIISECVNEVQMLSDLKDTDLVIRISGWEINRVSKTMKIIMEYGQLDLGVALKSSPFSVLQVKSTWESMLKIVAKIHERGIVHSDLKPANFVWVGNKLKIIDFGIASRLQNDHTSIHMLNPKGTLNYISPETICPDKSGKMKIGPKSDIWSLGCILYLMVYGKTPFHDFTHYISKIQAISSGNISYPPLPSAFKETGVITVLRSCFLMDHRRRPTAVELLSDPFLAGGT